MLQPNILLPSWHLEDVSRDLKESEAAAILNAYAVALHPWVLAASRTVPTWTAAPSPGEIETNRIVILPEPSRSKLPAGWLAQAQEQGVIILVTTADRAETLQKLRGNDQLKMLLAQTPALAETDSLDLDAPPVAEADFVAIGTVYLLTQLLSQAMYHYDNVDETRFTDFMVEAAGSSIAQKTEAVQELLKIACEQLLESREKFYATEAHLIDLCLLGEGVSDEQISDLTNVEHVVNVLCTAEFVEKLADRNPELSDLLKSAFHADRLSLLGGEYQEVATPLLPIQTSRWQMLTGLETYQKHLETSPAVWMRMRYGLSTQLPLIAKKSGLDCVYHLVLDDGMYPDDEQSHVAWEGRSSSVVQAISRIPLSVENAASLLKIPERMAEAMNHDHLACVVLARWPKLRNPWFQDFIRVQELAPVLGFFARLDSFLKDTEDSGHYTSHEQRVYQSPYLDQLTGRDAADPISRFVRFWNSQTTLQTINWLETTQKILTGRSSVEQNRDDDESRLQAVANTLDGPELESLEAEWRQRKSRAARDLTETLTVGGTEGSGFLVLNPLAQARRAVVAFPVFEKQGVKQIPKLSAAVKHLQVDDELTLGVVDIPACGFAAVATEPLNEYRPAKQKVPLAGETFLQNEFFYVQIDPDTGGIQRLRVHGSTENLLSERLVMRLDGSAGTIPRGSGQWGATSPEPQYSQMVADSVAVLQTGPVVGEIEVQGRLLVPGSEELVAEFQQNYVVSRGLRNLRIETQIIPQKQPTQLADRSYYAHRFAWAAAGATVRGTLMQSQYRAGEKRIESTGPIEIDDNEHRITLLPHFRPFHQRTALRMLDSLLIVHGESTQKFVYDVAVDAPHATLLADQIAVPPILETVARLPKSSSAWLFHVSAPSVSLVNVVEESINDSAAADPPEQFKSCFRFDFLETEGKQVVVKFSTVRPAKQAWEVDFRGEIQSPLSIENDCIEFECLPCDYLSVRVVF